MSNCHRTYQPATTHAGLSQQGRYATRRREISTEYDNERMTEEDAVLVRIIVIYVVLFFAVVGKAIYSLFG